MDMVGRSDGSRRRSIVRISKSCRFDDLAVIRSLMGRL
jgi:hypothetical protein